MDSFRFVKLCLSVLPAADSALHRHRRRYVCIYMCIYIYMVLCVFNYQIWFSKRLRNLGTMGKK